MKLRLQSLQTFRFFFFNFTLTLKVLIKVWEKIYRKSFKLFQLVNFKLGIEKESAEGRKVNLKTNYFFTQTSFGDYSTWYHMLFVQMSNVQMLCSLLNFDPIDFLQKKTVNHSYFIIINLYFQKHIFLVGIN